MRSHLSGSKPVAGIDCKIKTIIFLELNQSYHFQDNTVLSCEAVCHNCYEMQNFERDLQLDHKYRGKKLSIFMTFFPPRFSSCCSSKGKPSFSNVEDSVRQGILHFVRVT